MPARSRALFARIAEHVVQAPNGCWICDLELQTRGRGPATYVSGTGTRSVRRIMAGHSRGRPLTRAEVVRACPQDERCVNPAHLPVVPAATLAEANRRPRTALCEPNGWEIA